MSWKKKVLYQKKIPNLYEIELCISVPCVKKVKKKNKNKHDQMLHLKKCKKCIL